MRRASAIALPLIVVAAAAGIVRADVLHLAGGGTINAEKWWYEGDTLKVESEGGVIGFPRSMLVSVDSTTPKPKPDQPARAPAAADANPIANVIAADAPPSRHKVAPETAAKMKEGNAAIAARDYETASLRFYEVLKAEPGEIGPRVGYAAAEMALGRDAVALPVILDGLTQHPNSAELLEVLGALRDHDERVEEALAAWREAYRIAPTPRLKERIEKAERELAAGRDYAYSAAAHFTVRHDGALDQDLVGEITDYLESRYRDITGTYRHAPSQPITVLLYPSQAFHDVTQVGNEVVGLYDGKIRVPLGGLKRLDPAAKRVLTHELTHAIVASKSHGTCPRWLQEGLAQLAEPRTLRRSDLATLRQSVRADAPTTWPDKAFTYPAALSFTRFLQDRRGFDLLVDVVARLGDGDSIDTAFNALYGASFAELAAEWAGSLQGDSGE
jgi:hypothetical protein